MFSDLSNEWLNTDVRFSSGFLHHGRVVLISVETFVYVAVFSICLGPLVNHDSISFDGM